MTQAFYTRLHWGDYHKGTSHLRTAAEHGAYLLLIGAVTTAGGRLKADDVLLGRLTRCTPRQWAKLKGVVLPFFQVRGGLISHKRVTKELAKIAATSRKRKLAGQIGGRVRPGNHSASGEANAKQTVYTKTETETETETTKVKKTLVAARRCPEDWMPTPADLVVGYDAGLTVEQISAELAKLQDHEFAKPRKDWSATFRNWLREAAERKTRHAPGSSPDDKLQRRHDNYAASVRGADRAAGRTVEP